MVCGYHGVWLPWCVVTMVWGYYGVWLPWCVVTMVCGYHGVGLLWCVVTMVCGNYMMYEASRSCFNCHSWHIGLYSLIVRRKYYKYKLKRGVMSLVSMDVCSAPSNLSDKNYSNICLLPTHLILVNLTTWVGVASNPDNL